jgi:hypothetical protein
VPGKRRVDLLYLADSILFNSQKNSSGGGKAHPAAAEAYPRIIAAALPHLIKAASEDKDGLQKCVKVRARP